MHRTLVIIFQILNTTVRLVICPNIIMTPGLEVMVSRFRSRHTIFGRMHIMRLVEESLIETCYMINRSRMIKSVGIVKIKTRVPINILNSTIDIGRIRIIQMDIRMDRINSHTDQDIVRIDHNSNYGKGMTTVKALCLEDVMGHHTTNMIHIDMLLTNRWYIEGKPIEELYDTDVDFIFLQTKRFL